MPFPTMTDDDVAQFLVVEAVGMKAISEQLDAQDQAQKEAATKQHTRGPGLKQFAKGD